MHRPEPVRTLRFLAVCLALLATFVAFGPTTWAASAIVQTDESSKGSAPAAETQIPEPQFASWSRADLSQLNPATAAILQLPRERLNDQLTRISIEFTARRKMQAALDALEALWLRAALDDPQDPKFIGRLELLVRLAEQRAQLLSALGRKQEALDATWQLLPGPEHCKSLLKTEQFVVLTPSISARIRETSKRLDSVRNQIRRASPEPQDLPRDLRERIGKQTTEEFKTLRDYVQTQFGLPTQAILELTLEDLPPRGINQLDLGRTATASLAWIGLARRNDTNPVRMAALGRLAQINPNASARIMVDWYTNGSDLWRERIGHQIEHYDFLDELWSSPDGSLAAARYRDQAWIELLSVAIKDPKNRDRVLAKLPQLTGYDGIPTNMLPALIAIAQGSDREEALQLLGYLASPLYTPSTETVYAAGLQSPHAEIQELCARALSDFGSDAILSLATSEKPAMRKLVPAAWQPHSLKSASLQGGVKTVHTIERELVWSAQHSTAAEALWNSDDNQLRGETVRAMAIAPSAPAEFFLMALSEGDHETALVAAQALVDRSRKLSSLEGSQAIRSMTQHDFAEVRAELARMELPNSPELHQAWLQLSEDTDQRVLNSIDQRLARRGLGCGPDMDLAILEQRFAHATHSFGQAGQLELGARKIWQDLKDRLGKQPKLGLRYARLGLRQGSEDLINMAWWKGDQNDHQVALVAASSDRELAELFLWTRRNDRDREFSTAIALADVDLGGAMAQLFRDANQPIRVRTYAIAFYRPQLDLPEDRRSLIDILSAPEWKSGRLRTKTIQADWLRTPSNPLLLELLSLESISEPVQARCAEVFMDAQGPDGLETALLVLERWQAGPTQPAASTTTGDIGSAACQVALRALVHSPQESGIDAALERAFESNQHNQQEAALYVVERLGLERHRKLLDKVLSMRGASDPVQAVELQSSAILALARFGDEACLLQLRSALPTVHVNARPVLLETIQMLETSLESERQTLDTRDEALIKLVEWLSSENAEVRTEAVRGLGTFGAIEAIPMLIPLLEDPSDKVRVAVREALKRLNQ